MSSQSNKMISSCSDCKTVCCKFGPGPYRVLEPTAFLDEYGLPEAYNTKCSGLTDDSKCSYWDTPKLPVECRWHICSVRTFSQKEFEEMDTIREEECENCKRDWTQIIYTDDNGICKRWCTACGWEETWEFLDEKPGKIISTV